jgi:hypothetical protein
MKKWVLIIGLGLPVLLYCFILACSLSPVAVHDEDLQLARASIPEGSNAFDILQQAASHLWQPDTDGRVLSALARDTNWDANMAATILANNRQTLADWDAAAKLSDLQVPEIQNSGDLLPYLPDWKKLALLARVRENFLLHSGKVQEAFDHILNDSQTSRRMQNGRGPLICYLVGISVDSMALNQIRHWVGQTHLDATQLKSYLRKLQLDPDEDGIAFANTIKAEYHMETGTLAAWNEGKLPNPLTGAQIPRPPRWLPTFNLNRTKALFAKTSLLLVKDAPLHFNEAKLPDWESNRPSLVSMGLSGNAVGEMMYGMIESGIVAALAKKSQENVQLQATRIILALRAYELKHGSLPPALSALVPEFLDEVPVDDFDGQPLRYVRERKMVYSVGKNLKDDGGDDTRSGPIGTPLDLVYRFDF